MIRVNLTNEEGEVLDTFSVERTSCSSPALSSPEAEARALAYQVRSIIEHSLEVEDL